MSVNTCEMLRNNSSYRQSSDASFYCDPVAEAHIILIAPLRQQRPAYQAECDSQAESSNAQQLICCNMQGLTPCPPEICHEEV